MIRILLKKRNSNNYSGSDWNFEETTKYVLEINEKLVEAGYFKHYNKSSDGMMILKKEVIELPSSQGCPIRCGYCASSQIMNVSKLSFEEIYQIFCFIYEDKRISGDNYLLVTMTGIGDYSVCYENINKAIEIINKNYKNVHFTISSSIWTDESINGLNTIINRVDFRAINITYISSDMEKVRKVISKDGQYKYNIKRVIHKFASTTIPNLRINYIMIRNINDNHAEYKSFVSLCESIKDQIIIRISKMNTTISSQRANLLSAEVLSMQELCNLLNEHGFSSYLFFSFSDDHMNCGQLLLEE